MPVTDRYVLDARYLFVFVCLFCLSLLFVCLFVFYFLFVFLIFLYCRLHVITNIQQFIKYRWVLYDVSECY